MKSLSRYLLENQSINFDRANSNYGECIIFAGGPGSGKGYVAGKRVLANFKVFDVDELKKRYIKMAENNKLKDKVDDTKYDLTDPADVTKLHFAVKERGWKNKQRELLKQRSTLMNAPTKRNAQTLPNILFDMVCDNIKDVKEVIALAKEMGYRITLVWVVCNMDTAREGNAHRERRVSDTVIVNGHTGCRATMLSLLNNEYPEVNSDIDRVWLAFSAGYKRMLSDIYERTPVVKIKKDKDDNFIFNNKKDVKKFLDEQQPVDPDWDEKKRKADEEFEMKRATAIRGIRHMKERNPDVDAMKIKEELEQMTPLEEMIMREILHA